MINSSQREGGGEEAEEKGEKQRQETTSNEQQPSGTGLVDVQTKDKNEKDLFVVMTERFLTKEKNYVIGKEPLDFGTFAKVHEVTRNGQRMAVKIMDCKQMTDGYISKHLSMELKVLPYLKHPHIVKVLDMYQFSQKVKDTETGNIRDRVRLVYIFMEFAGNGNLLDMIEKNQGLSEVRARRYIEQVVDALHYMHSDIHWAHRDIKPDNILLDSNDEVKLTDFGFSRAVDDTAAEQAPRSATFCGSMRYKAPEILKKLHYDMKAADIWSPGITVFVSLADEFPFNGKSPAEDVHLIETRGHKFSPHLDSTLSQEVKCLMQRMLEPDATKRITISEIKAHQWFTLPITSLSSSPSTSPVSSSASSSPDHSSQ